jgi:methylated-DNA-[protein]-cysteine S-methyltransferase
MSRVDAPEIKQLFRDGVESQAEGAAVRFAERASREGLADVAYATFDSPYGQIHVAVTDRGLVSLALPNVPEEAFLATLANEISPRVLELPARLDDVRRELDEYFAGSRRDFDLKLDWRLIRSGFYRSVLRETKRLPYGATSTYGEIAARAGNPRAARAAGTALATNPIPLVIPCHRILRSGGVVGNYGGGPAMKQSLLEAEGSLPSERWVRPD